MKISCNACIRSRHTTAMNTLWGLSPGGCPYSPTTLPGGGGAHSSGGGSPRDGGSMEGPHMSCIPLPYLTLPHIPTIPIPHQPAQCRLGRSLSSAGSLQRHIYPQPSSQAWRAADAERVPERGRYSTARPTCEFWGWQPWDGAARENVERVVRRLVGTKM